MASISKTDGAVITPVNKKIADSNRSRSIESEKYSENINPNVCNPGLKFSSCPSIVKMEKSAKKSASRNPKMKQVPGSSPTLRKKLRERKFVVVKKKSSRNEDFDSSTIVVVACDKCKKTIGKSKCLCLAYESLRASHEKFFRSPRDIDDNGVDIDKVNELEDGDNIVEGKMEGDNEKSDDINEVEVNIEANLKRSRDRLLELARESIPETGSGRVMHLVKAFEKLSLLKLRNFEERNVENDNKELKWALAGLQELPNVSEMQVSSSSFCPSNFFLTSESLGLDSRHSYSLDSSQGSFSTKTSAGSQRIRRNSNESSGTFSRRQWKRKQRKTTSQKPFMLRTEQRGRSKEEEFMKKWHQLMEEEEKLRIPLAQGLPWTTDVPECLPKPPAKENTKPLDLVLHTDIRAIERSEFDHQVAEKMSLIEQYRMERGRQQRLAEEEEIRKLRKELVPKAQPMPYFDRPFIPRRSMKHPTIPKEPKFHVPQHKKIKCCMSLDDFDTQEQQ